MSTTLTAADLEKRGCLPHQAEFVARFFSPDAPRVMTLVGTAGMGKGFAAAEACRHAFTTGTSMRILVIASREVLATHFADLLRTRDQKLPVFLLDRRAFWHMESSTPTGASPFADRCLIVLATGVLRHADVAEAVYGADWGMIVVDEIESAGQPPGSTIHQFLLNQSTARILLLARPSDVDEATAVIDSQSGVHAFPTGPLAPSPLFDQLMASLTKAHGAREEPRQDDRVTSWTAAAIRESDASRPFLVNQIQWAEYARNDREITVLARLQSCAADRLGICPKEDPHRRPTLFMSLRTLTKLASSSLYALERSLGRMQSRQDARADVDVDLFPDSEPDTQRILDFGGLPQAVLPLIEAVATDSKKTALLDLLARAPNSGTEARACVYTNFLDTAEYLVTAIADRFANVFALTGRLSPQDRERTARECEAAHGILVLTAAVTCEPPRAGLVVLYDLPTEPAVLEARVAQLARVRGGTPPAVIAFDDTTHALATEVVERTAFKAGERPTASDLLKAISGDRFPAP